MMIPRIPARPQRATSPAAALALALPLLLALALSACSKPADLPAMAPLPPTGAGATPQVADIDLTTQVRTALLQDEQLKAFDLAVITTNGDVRITGSVDTQAQIDRSLALAQAVPGVHSLHDEVMLKK